MMGGAQGQQQLQLELGTLNFVSCARKFGTLIGIMRQVEIEDSLVDADHSIADED